MLTRLDHVELVPRDLERSLSFYRDILGFTVAHRYPVEVPPFKEIAYLTCAGAAIELIRMDLPEAAPHAGNATGYRMMAWEVADMDATLETLARRGVPCTWGPLRTPALVRAEIQDPDGNAIELRQWLERPSGIAAPLSA